jgi:peptide/nickel transport system substrate-binding protein
MYPLILSGAATIAPTTRLVRANGEVASNGSAGSAEIEVEIAGWFDARTLDEEKAATHRLNRVTFEKFVYARLGTLLRRKAYRKNVSCVVPGPPPLFWGVGKTA